MKSIMICLTLVLIASTICQGGRTGGYIREDFKSNSLYIDRAIKAAKKEIFDKNLVSISDSIVTPVAGKHISLNFSLQTIS
jgi:hypothetical protein